MIRPLYKAQEPFMEVKRGFGYQGVVMYDDEEDKVQCHICGKWFSNMGRHVPWAHDMSADDYKMDHGLTLRTALCGKKMAAVRSRIGRRGFLAGKLKLHYGKRPYQKNRRVNRQVPNTAVQTKNKFGLCDLQIKYRYDIVKKMAGRIPRDKDFKKFDLKLWNAMKRRHRTLNAFRKHIGEIQLTRFQQVRIPDINLIAALRSWAHEHKQIPSASVFDSRKLRGNRPSTNVMKNHFGSWSNALRMAGLK